MAYSRVAHYISYSIRGGGSLVPCAQHPHCQPIIGSPPITCQIIHHPQAFPGVNWRDHRNVFNYSVPHRISWWWKIVVEFEGQIIDAVTNSTLTPLYCHYFPLFFPIISVQIRLPLLSRDSSLTSHEMSASLLFLCPPASYTVACAWCLTVLTPDPGALHDLDPCPDSHHGTLFSPLCLTRSLPYSCSLHEPFISLYIS
jgi:hypothetical protein